MILVPVEEQRDATETLYALLQERPSKSAISHKEMPWFEDHKRFVKNHPYRHWYLIHDGGVRGDICATQNNEIGIHIFKHSKRKGYATKALDLFMKTHLPLPAIPAVRVESWVANVAPDNLVSLAFFEKLGFQTRQYTMVQV